MKTKKEKDIFDENTKERKETYLEMNLRKRNESYEFGLKQGQIKAYKKCIEILEKNIFEMTNTNNFEEAKNIFEKLRKIEFEKTPKLFKIISCYQIAIYFKEKEEIEKELENLNTTKV